MSLYAEKNQLVALPEFEAMAKNEQLNYELIDGVVLMSPRPSLEHQNVSGNLYFELRQQLKDADCKPILEVDLVLANDSLVPDLMIICDQELQGKRYEKPPLIVMEIISPTSASRDHIIQAPQIRRIRHQRILDHFPGRKMRHRL